MEKRIEKQARFVGMEVYNTVSRRSRNNVERVILSISQIKLKLRLGVEE